MTLSQNKIVFEQPLKSQLLKNPNNTQKDTLGMESLWASVRV